MQQRDSSLLTKYIYFYNALCNILKPQPVRQQTVREGHVNLWGHMMMFVLREPLHIIWLFRFMKVIQIGQIILGIPEVLLWFPLPDCLSPKIISSRDVE